MPFSFYIVVCWIGDKFVRAKKTKHIPAVFTKQKTKDVLSNLKSTSTNKNRKACQIILKY
jgi:hypothetical protein